MTTKHFLDYPENYLWVSHPDGKRTLIDEDRLRDLAAGATPEDEVEQLLVENQEWLYIYQTHVLGTHPLTIPAGGPLPEWSAAWLDGLA
jgi:hypothetical protein